MFFFIRIGSYNFRVGMGGFLFGIMEMALKNPFGLPLKKKNCLSPEMFFTRGEFFSFRQANKDFSHFRAALIFWFFCIKTKEQKVNGREIKPMLRC